MHQKGTSLSDEAVVPSQFGGTFEHKNNIKRVFRYTPLPGYFWLIDVIHSYCILFQFFVLIFETKGRSTCSLYLLRPTLVHIGIESGSTADRGTTDTHQYIFTLFRVPHELENGVRKWAIQAHASIHIYEISFLIQENNYPSQHTVFGNYRPLASWCADWGPLDKMGPARHNLSFGFQTQCDLIKIIVPKL